MHIITLYILKILFECNEEKYCLEFEAADGIEALEAIQLTEVQQVYDIAADIIEKFFNGAEVDTELTSSQPSPEQVESVDDDKDQPASQVFRIWYWIIVWHNAARLSHSHNSNDVKKASKNNVQVVIKHYYKL